MEENGQGGSKVICVITVWLKRLIVPTKLNMIYAVRIASNLPSFTFAIYCICSDLYKNIPLVHYFTLKNPQRNDNFSKLMD